MIKLAILGQTPSKKNSPRILYRWKRGVRGKPFVAPSKISAAWATTAILQLKTQRPPGPPIDSEIILDAQIYRWGRRKADLSNLIQSIEDALQAAEIIKDDFLINGYGDSQRFLGCPKGEERAEIKIYRKGGEDEK